jgi:hypothetical protein
MALRSVPRACLSPTEGPRNVVGADEALSQQTGLPQSKGTRAGARARAESAPSWAGRPPPPPPPPLPPTGLAHISLSLSSLCQQATILSPTLLHRFIACSSSVPPCPTRCRLGA